MDDPPPQPVKTRKRRRMEVDHDEGESEGDVEKSVMSPSKESRGKEKPRIYTWHC